MLFKNQRSSIWQTLDSFENLFFLQDYFGWINGDKLYFARNYNAKRAESELKTIQNSKDVAVFDAFLQHNRQGFKNAIFTYTFLIRINADLY